MDDLEDDEEMDISESELNETYVMEKYDEWMLEVVVESMFFMKEYIAEHRLSIGDQLTSKDLFEFLFE